MTAACLRAAPRYCQSPLRLIAPISAITVSIISAKINIPAMSRAASEADRLPMLVITRDSVPNGQNHISSFHNK